MRIQEITSRKLRDNQSKILDKVSCGKPYHIVNRYGKKQAVLISCEAYRLIAPALEELEEKGDIRAVKSALKRSIEKGGGKMPPPGD